MSRSFSTDLDAETLGELLVERRGLGRAHLLDLHVEARGLTGEARLGVAVGEGRLDLALVARAGAGQSFLEARNEIAAAEHDWRVLGRAAREGVAVDRADEVDDQAVAVRGRAVFRLVARIGGAQPVERLVDVVVGHLGDRLLERDLAEVHQLELGQHLEGQRVGEVARAGEDLVDLRLVLRQRDVRLEGGTLLALRDGFAARLGDGLLHHFGHHRAAIDFAQMLLRHMAGAEALDPHPALQIVEARREAPL